MKTLKGTSLSRLVLMALAVVSSGQAQSQSQGSNWAQDCRARGGQVVDYRVSRVKEGVRLHLNAPAVPAEKRDAAWDEYVCAYRKAADLVVDKKLCTRLAP